MKNLVLISQLAINVIVPTFLCLFIGLWLDRKLGTDFIAVILMILGMTAGFRNAYIMARDSVKSGKEEDPQDIVDRVNGKKK